MVPTAITNTNKPGNATRQTCSKAYYSMSIQHPLVYQTDITLVGGARFQKDKAVMAKTLTSKLHKSLGDMSVGLHPSRIYSLWY